MPNYPGFKAYPRWVTALDGSRIIVQNAHGETVATGRLMNEDGTEADQGDKPKPPTLEEVIKAGYKEDAARKIVADEQLKFSKGLPPYGEVPEPLPPAATSVASAFAPPPSELPPLAATAAPVHESPPAGSPTGSVQVTESVQVGQEAQKDA
jgi:hypothetical protein